MKSFASLSILTLFLVAGCGDKPAATTPPASGAGNTPPNAPANYLGGLVNAENRAVQTVDVAALNQAVQLFNVQEGRLPKDLNELVEKKLIAKVPDAPNGMKLKYDAASGVVSVVKAD
jgi:stage V sporulation protein SpoVS